MLVLASDTGIELIKLGEFQYFLINQQTPGNLFLKPRHYRSFVMGELSNQSSYAFNYIKQNALSYFTKPYIHSDGLYLNDFLLNFLLTPLEKNYKNKSVSVTLIPYSKLYLPLPKSKILL